MKQTAVEWLEEHIIIGLTYDQQLLFEATFEQAKAMEKEQIIDAFDYGDSNLFIDKDGEHYYNETFKSE